MDSFVAQRFATAEAAAAAGAVVRSVTGTAGGLLLGLQTPAGLCELGFVLVPGAAWAYWLGPQPRAALAPELSGAAPEFVAPLDAAAGAPPGTTVLDALRAWMVRPGSRSGTWSHLVGARLDALAAPARDRVLELQFTRDADRVTPELMTLRAELFDWAANLVLQSADGTEVANWRGRVAKPPRVAASPSRLDAAGLRRALASPRALCEARGDLDLLEARAALAAAGDDPQALAAWLEKRDAAPADLAFRWDAGRGLTVELAPPSSGLSLTAAALLGASDAMAGELVARHARSARRQVDRLARLVDELERDAAAARQADERRQEAELLGANLHALRRGLREVTVEDFFAAGAPRTIALDPAQSPQENVARLYKEARRATRSHAPIASRLAAARRDLEAARQACPPTAPPAGWPAAVGVAVGAWRAACAATLRTPPEALWRAGGPPVAPPGRHAPVAAEARGTGPGRCFVLGGKWEVRVGRTNAENDLLTHRFAQPDDIWMHASGVPGSHVVLRMQGRNSTPPREVLEAAAAIAARFSKAKHAGTVPVLWTRKRYVRKPRGAKPGLAACTHEKTLFVRPGLPDGTAAD